MRRASLAAFIAGLLLYLPAFYFTSTAFGLMLISHGGANSQRIDRDWLVGRTLSVTSVVLLVTSVVLAFLVPVDPRRKRSWWAVPATVVVIAIVYFDWINIWFNR